MINLNNINEIPIYYKEKYKNYKEVLYYGDMINYNLKDSVQNNIVLNHNDYIISPFNYKPAYDVINPNDFYQYEYYAFGLSINIFNTNIITLDFDEIQPFRINDIINILKTDNNICEIDLLQSSKHDYIGSYHLVIGFDKFINAASLINNIPYMCSGFKEYINIRKQLIIRVSEKIYQNMIDDKIQLLKKEIKVNNTWQEYIFDNNKIYTTIKIRC